MPRAAKTIRQHYLQGTVPQGKPDSPSNYAGGRPKIPKHLSLVARREFKRICQLLENRGTLCEGDGQTIAVLSEVYARWVDCKKALGDQFLVTTQLLDSSGTLRTVTRTNPLVKICQDCESKILALTKSLGLTPTDRDKVKPTTIDPSLEVIPGSLAETNPELFGSVAPLRKPIAVDPEDMGAE